MSSSSTPTKKHKGGLLGEQAVYEVNHRSRVYCAFCGKAFLVTSIGVHMNSQCKAGMKAMGKDPEVIEKQRKIARNAKNKEKSTHYEYRLKVNRAIWIRAYNKKKPVKSFDSKFIRVKTSNPFHLEESELVSDKDMEFLFGKMKHTKWKENAQEVITYFAANQTRTRQTNWKAMLDLNKKVFGTKVQRPLHSDKIR